MPYTHNFSDGDIRAINEMQRKFYNSLSRSSSLQLRIANAFDSDYSNDNGSLMDGKFAQRVFKYYGRQAHSYGWNKKMQEEHLPITEYKAFSQKSDPTNWITTRKVIPFGIVGLIAGAIIATFVPPVWAILPLLLTPIVGGSFGALVAHSDKLAVRGFIQKGYEDAETTINKLDSKIKQSSLSRSAAIEKQIEKGDIEKKEIGKYEDALLKQRQESLELSYSPQL